MINPYVFLKGLHELNFLISGMYPINRDECLAVIEYDCVLVKRAAGTPDWFTTRERLPNQLSLICQLLDALFYLVNLIQRRSSPADDTNA